MVHHFFLSFSLSSLQFFPYLPDFQSHALFSFITYIYECVNEYSFTYVICVHMFIHVHMCIFVYMYIGTTTGHWIINSCQPDLFSKHKQHLLSHEMTSSHWNLLNYSFPPCSLLCT